MSFNMFYILSKIIINKVIAKFSQSLQVLRAKIPNKKSINVKRKLDVTFYQISFKQKQILQTRFTH